MKKIKLLLVLSILNIGINNGQSRTETDSIGIVLRALYDNLDGDNWKRKDNWFSDKPYEEWYGLRFDRSGLYGINLMDNNLTGVLPPEVGMLPHSCSFLDIRRNNISGNLPIEILNVPHLYPWIMENKFTGKLPEEFKSAPFYDEEWLRFDVVRQKYGYGFDFPVTTNMIELDNNIYLHPNFNAIEYRLSKDDFERFAETGTNEKEITKKLYNLFEDKFDFIAYIFNEYKFTPLKTSYEGWFSNVKNGIEGIGCQTFDISEKYGSKGRLNGLIHTLREYGPFTHEIMHNWCGLDLGQFVYKNNKLYKQSVHWGISDINGVLGGFSQEKLKMNVDGNPHKYQIPNLISNDSYAPLELYLMGLLDIKEVPDIHVYDNITLFEAGAPTTFIAETVNTWTWQDIERTFGKRNPSFENSQKKFSILNVVLTIEPINDLEWFIIQDAIEFKSKKEEVNSPFHNYKKNFWHATGGRASVEMDKLNEKLKNPIVSNDKIDIPSSLRLAKNQDVITISSKKLIERLEVYDINGRFIKKESVNRNNHTIHLKPNIHYIIKAYFKDKIVESIKI